MTLVQDTELEVDTIEMVVADTLSTLRSRKIDTVRKLEDRLMGIEQKWTEPFVIADEKSTIDPLSKDDKKHAKTLTAARSRCMEPSVTMDVLLSQYAELLYERTSEYPLNVPAVIRLHLERHGYHR